MTIPRHVTGVALFVVLAGCGGPQIQAGSDFDQRYNLAGYRTFSWIADDPVIVGKTDLPPSPLLTSQLTQATQATLIAKGFQYIEDAEEADFVVAFTIGSRRNIEVDSYPAAYQGYWGGPRYWGDGYYGEVHTRTYTEGRLSIDLFDVQTRQPVWHGWATKEITSKDRKKTEPVLRKVVETILDTFPPVAVTAG